MFGSFGFCFLTFWYFYLGIHSKLFFCFQIQSYLLTPHKHHAPTPTRPKYIPEKRNGQCFSSILFTTVHIFYVYFLLYINRMMIDGYHFLSLDLISETKLVVVFIYLIPRHSNFVWVLLINMLRYDFSHIWFYFFCAFGNL